MKPYDSVRGVARYLCEVRPESGTRVVGTPCESIEKAISMVPRALERVGVIRARMAGLRERILKAQKA